MPYERIGAMFGVKGKQIGKILRGEQWKGGVPAKPGFKPGDPRHPAKYQFRRNGAFARADGQ
jgi:hypothetical protein